MEQDGDNPAASTVSDTSSQNGDHSGHESDNPDSLDYELDPEKRREARKLRRVMANRRSARESRERRKKLLTDLQDSVEGLTSENASLTKENLGLRKELAELLQQSGLAGANGGNLSNLALQLQPPETVVSGTNNGPEADNAGSSGDVDQNMSNSGDV